MQDYEINYINGQFNALDLANAQTVRINLATEAGRTNYMNITPAQAEKIKEILLAG
jgi:hypothetical protein